MSEKIGTLLKKLQENSRTKDNVVLVKHIVSTNSLLQQWDYETTIPIHLLEPRLAGPSEIFRPMLFPLGH